MPIPRTAQSVRWSLYRDSTCSETTCVLSGVLSVDLVQLLRPQTTLNSQGKPLNSACFSLASTGFQLAPDIQGRLWDLFERHQGAITNPKEGGTDGNEGVFPVAVEDLSLGSRVAELGLNNKDSVSCKLELGLMEGLEAKAETQDEDWFAWKLQRGAAYRKRGNEAFMHESYRSAVRLYKRALAWLEPPLIHPETSIDKHVQYSEEESQQVNPLAVACYTNMATCYSKLKDMDRCIAAASSALALDDTHVKARYRRSQAYVSSKEFDLALADLIKLREVEPANRLFQSALTKAHIAKTKLREKQQNAYANLLDK